MSVEVIKGIENISGTDSETVATIGTFDGLHRGHQAILDRVANSAKKRDALPLVITFEPHPRVLVTPDSPPPLLTCLNEKVKLFDKYFDGKLLVMEFNKEIMNLTAEEFTLRYLIDRVKLGKLVVGYDHAFGKNRSGTINDLLGLSKQHNFELEIVNPVIVEGKPISSTRIRKLLIDHKLSQALELLDHGYPIAGKVKKGIGLGKKLGYPTANIEVSERKLLPYDGVYSCQIEVDGHKHEGMMFIGKNHFNPELVKSIEVNIFDFEDDIYDKEIFCYPEIYIRENRKYDDVTKLVEQINKDKEKVLNLKQ